MILTDQEIEQLAIQLVGGKDVQLMSQLSLTQPMMARLFIDFAKILEKAEKEHI